MKKTKNQGVVSEWKEGHPAENHRGSLRTDGFKLWSYDLMIGDTCEATGLKILKNYTAKGRGFYSQTTSCHVNLAARTAADLVD